MLNKAICKRCLNKEVPLVDWDDSPWENFLWDESNERMWSKGRVCCPYANWWDIRHSEFEEHCPYVTEHIVSSSC